jgi:hypothetical protein
VRVDFIFARSQLGSDIFDLVLRANNFERLPEAIPSAMFAIDTKLIESGNEVFR